MKRSNPAMSKPSLGRVNFDLNKYQCNTRSKLSHDTTCKKCGKQFTFYEKDLVDKIIKCPHCGAEEIFFACNYNY